MKLPLDKKLHLAVGFVISILSYALLNEFMVKPQICFFASTLLSSVAGIFKEVYDGFFPKKHTVDIYDLSFTAAGGLVGAFAFYGIDVFILK